MEEVNIRGVNQILIEDQEDLSALMTSNLREYDKVIVLGCTGMLGYYITAVLVLHFARSIPMNHISVVGVSRTETKQIQDLKKGFPSTFKRISFDRIDAEFKSLKKILVIHAASPSSIQSISHQPRGAIETNIQLTIKTAELIEKNGGHIVFLSSGEVYGDSARVPTSESDYSPINHLSQRGLYPEIKKTAEAILQIYCQTTEKITGTSLRVFHTFGPGIKLDDPRIFGLVCKAIHKKEEIVLNSDGSTIRVFMYTKDLVSAILHTIEVKGFNVFNVAGKEPISIANFCELSLGLGVPNIVYKTDEDLIPRNIQTGFADTSKLEALGWVPSVSTLDTLWRTSKTL